jgi:hypothetical protein
LNLAHLLQKVSNVDECKSNWFYLLLLKEKPCPAFRFVPETGWGRKEEEKRENKDVPNLKNELYLRRQRYK